MFLELRLFLNTTTWANVHILHEYGKPVSLSACACDCASMRSSTSVPMSPKLVGPFCLLPLSRVAPALMACAVRNVAARFLLLLLLQLPGFIRGYLVSSVSFSPISYT